MDNGPRWTPTGHVDLVRASLYMGGERANTASSQWPAVLGKTAKTNILNILIAGAL